MQEGSEEARRPAREGERRAGVSEAWTATAPDETGSAPLPSRQEWRRTIQRRTALLQHRRRLGR